MSDAPSPVPSPPSPTPERSGVLSRAYWVMMLLGAMCLAIAALVGFAGPRLFHVSNAHAPPLGVAGPAYRAPRP